jgi:general secretion pathway protein G
MNRGRGDPTAYGLSGTRLEAVEKAPRRWYSAARTCRTRPPPGARVASAFTLIELIVVMAIIALLLSIAVPRYWHSTDKAKEAVLKGDLAQMRIAIDQYHADRAKYPDRLEDLVERKYLRTIPQDPVTESATTWIVVPPSDPAMGAVYDIKSGAPGTATDGRNFSEW